MTNETIGFCARMTAALILAAGPASVGQAQQPAGAAAAVLEEIVVTARRREESLQEVPVAVTALSSADLELRNIDNVQNLDALLPNVWIRAVGPTGASVGRFAVRGIPGVARYYDGIAQTSGEASLASVIELERIEVLKGPQGTLFGKNALGGAIQYISTRPAEEFGARFKATTGSYNRRDLIANVDIPLSDTLRSKLTFASLHKDGFVDSTTVDESYGEENNEIIRGVLEWTPNDDFMATVIFEYNDINQNMQPHLLWDVYDGQPAGTPSNRTPLAYQQQFALGDPLVPVNFTDELQAFGLREEYKTTSNYQGPGTDIEQTAVKLDLQWDLTDSLSLRSLTGVREVEYGNFDDQDGTQYIQFDVWNYRENSETSQEIQLLGSGDRFSWVAGIYYFNTQFWNKEFAWQRIEMVNNPRGPRLTNELGYSEETDTAIFAEGTYDITDTVTLTLGARNSEEEFSYRILDDADVAQSFPAPWTLSRSLAGTTTVGPGGLQQGTMDFDQTTVRVALQRQFTDDIMAYISYAEGFDGGGVNTGFTPLLPNNGILPYDGQTLKNWELGLRSDFLDNRLRINATLSDGTWDDIQVGEILVPGMGTRTNAGEAEVSALEIEGIWLITDNAQFNFAAGWLDTGYTELGRTRTITLDTPFPNAPETSYSLGLQFINDLSNGSEVLTRFDYGWNDDYELSRDARFQVSTHNKAFGLLSGRIQYTAPDGNWSLALIGQNLTNEYYRLGGIAGILAGIDFGVAARPREIGLRLFVNFD